MVIIAKHLDDFQKVEEQSITATTKSEKKKQGQYDHGCRVGICLAVMETEIGG